MILRWLCNEPAATEIVFEGVLHTLIREKNDLELLKLK
jgi:hypothetical protein